MDWWFQTKESRFWEQQSGCWNQQWWFYPSEIPISNPTWWFCHVSIKQGGLSINNGGLIINNPDFTIDNDDFTIRNGGLPIKHSDFAIKKKVNSGELPTDNWLVVSITENMWKPWVITIQKDGNKDKSCLKPPAE